MSAPDLPTGPTRGRSSPPPGPGTDGPHIEPGPHGTLPQHRPLTATGKVTRDPEHGCLLLVAGDTAYELRGDQGVLPGPGTRATVIGEVDRTLTPRCGGTPLVVHSVHQAN